MTINKRFLILMIVFYPLVLSHSNAAPSPKLWSKWQVNDPTSQHIINHQSWQQFLTKYLIKNDKGIHLIRYFAVSQMDRRQLKNYIAYLATLKISTYHPDEQLAYWLNLYNALIIDLILDHFPILSIRDINISPGFFTVGPWDAPLVTIEEEAVTLSDIEHRILRPIWQDPRIHYALSCATLSCPNIQKLAYTRKNVHFLLDQAARDYINNPRGVQIKDGRLIVSKIYTWYMSDFGSSSQDVVNHLTTYAQEPLKSRLGTVYTIYDSFYDWSLNEAR